MPKIIRKKHSRELKFKGAMAMVAGNKTINEISKEFGVHQSVLHRWKKDLLEKGPLIFDRKLQNQNQDPTLDAALLQRKVGELTMEIDFLKQALKV